MMMTLMKTMILMMSVDDDVEALLQKKAEKKNYLFEELCMWFDILNISYLYVHLFLPSVNVCSATAYVRRYIILSAREGGVSVCGRLTVVWVAARVFCCLPPPLTSGFMPEGTGCLPLLCAPSLPPTPQCPLTAPSSTTYHPSPTAAPAQDATALLKNQQRLFSLCTL